MISWPVARAAARERLLSPSVVVIGICFVAVAAVTGGWRAGTETFSGFGAGVFFLLLTLRLGTGVLSDELGTGHAQLVLLRPLTRADWVGGRLAGAGIALAAVVGVAWAATSLAAVLRGQGFPASRLAALPLGMLWGFAWLSVLTALGAVLPGWTNAGALVLAAVLWVFVQSLPLALGKPEWMGLIREAGNYLGPQDPLPLAKNLREGLGPALYDLCWIFFAWLVAVLLFNRRELAGRRR
jgi:hypothetical protein